MTSETNLKEFWKQELINQQIAHVTADKRQRWMNYENNGNEYLIIGAVVRSKYSNIRQQHLTIGNVQNFVWSHKNDFEEWKSRLHCK